MVTQTRLLKGHALNRIENLNQQFINFSRLMSDVKGVRQKIKIRVKKEKLGKKTVWLELKVTH